MSIQKEELKILEELDQIAKNPNENEETEKSEDLVDKVTQGLDSKEGEGDDSAPEEKEEEGDGQENEPTEGDETEETEQGDEPEEKLTGAKFRHKLKAEKEVKEQALREVQEMKERLATLEGAQNAQQQEQQRQQEQTQEKEEIPDIELEPERYAIWKAGKLEKQVEEMKAQQQRQAAAFQWESMQQDYSKTHQNYNAAKDFLFDTEAQKLKQQYPSATDSQIKAHLKEQEYEFVGKLARSGLDPLKQIEFMAHQGGFRPKDEKQSIASKKKKISNINKNAPKNASLIGGSAAEQSTRLTANQILAMTMEEIQKFGKEEYKAEIKRLERV